jgi:hypothetical protein
LASGSGVPKTEDFYVLSSCSLDQFIGVLAGFAEALEVLGGLVAREAQRLWGTSRLLQKQHVNVAGLCIGAATKVAYETLGADAFGDFEGCFIKVVRLPAFWMH